MKRLKLIILAIILLMGCVIAYFYFFLPIANFGNLKKMYMKEIEDSDVKVEWFFYSAAYMETPDYITIEKNNDIDTICIAKNIVDLKIESDKIIICCCGNPQQYSSSFFKIPDKVMGYEIVVDTTYIAHSLTDLRYYYSKDD